ncbi:MAG: hypothetical protein ACRDK2_14630 [Solirubrobacteraceae bacterium]
MRARLLEMALRAYPLQVRLEQGEEMLGTALDLSCGSWSLFMQEALALRRGGLRARVRITTAVPPRQLAADVFAQAASLWAIYVLTTLFRAVTGAHWHATVEEVIYVVALLLSVVLAVLRYDRLAGLCGWGWIFVLLYMTRMPFSWSSGVSVVSQPLTGVILRSLIPAVGYTAMILAPRSGSHDPRRLAWLVGPGAIALMVPRYSAPGFEIVMLSAMLAAGLVRLASDPRLALACVLLLINVELSRWALGARLFNGRLLLGWVLASAPLVLAACVLRLYTAREPG